MRPGLFSLLLPVLALAKGPSRLPSQHLSTSAHVSAQDHAGRIRSLVDLGLKVGPLEVNVDLAAGFSNAPTKQSGTCSTPTVRREWYVFPFSDTLTFCLSLTYSQSAARRRSLSDVEKEEYLASIMCLANSTALATSPEPVDGVKSLYDNFVATQYVPTLLGAVHPAILTPDAPFTLAASVTPTTSTSSVPYLSVFLFCALADHLLGFPGRTLLALAPLLGLEVRTSSPANLQLHRRSTRLFTYLFNTSWISPG